jgi:hypothetical protein
MKFWPFCVSLLAEGVELGWKTYSSELPFLLLCNPLLLSGLELDQVLLLVNQIESDLISLVLLDEAAIDGCG